MQEELTQLCVIYKMIKIENVNNRKFAEAYHENHLTYKLLRHSRQDGLLKYFTQGKQDRKLKHKK
ncbi:CLUMA_CG016731, isoform A [Clunio marinus]|uniref:CLUMA_CG016731, isoform A n=1 Tax=Clunio marinus TaxID=568069 RepID=A0A1J1IV71_9DIPT|nr:CLUMA_CG016731, isoform A [Clunio marinus]